jgi:hypothetical protein
MSFILANNSNSSLATNNLTLAAYLLYRCPYFHLLPLIVAASIMIYVDLWELFFSRDVLAI